MLLILLISQEITMEHKSKTTLHYAKKSNIFESRLKGVQKGDKKYEE